MSLQSEMIKAHEEDGQAKYGLSRKEVTELLRFNSSVQKTIDKHIVDGKWTLSEECRKDIFQQLHNDKIGYNYLLEVAKRIFSGRWYTVTITSLSGRDDIYDGILPYSILSSETDGKPLLIHPDSDFYKLKHASIYSSASEEDCLKERESLGLSPDYVFLYSIEYELLKLIMDISEPVEKEQSALFWDQKSSSLLSVIGMTGREAQLSAKQGVMADKGRLIFNTSGLEWSISINDAHRKMQSNNQVQGLLDSILHEIALAGYSDTIVRIPMIKLMQQRGLTDKKSFRDQLIRMVKILDDAKITGNTKAGDYYSWKYTQGNSKLINGILIVSLTDEFLDYLKKVNERVLYPNAILRLPSKGSSGPIARKFTDHKRISLGKKNENRLSVRTLLSVCSLPLYETLQRPSQASQKIIAEFNNALDEIEKKGIFSAVYRMPGGRKLNAEELKRSKSDYHFWANLIVEAHWISEPDYSILRERKKAQQEVAEKQAEQSEGKKKRGRPKKKPST